MATVTAPPLHVMAPLRLTVPTSWRGQSELFIDAQAITWQDTTVEFGQIEAVAYETRTRSLNLVQRRIDRCVAITADGTQLALRLSGPALGPRRDAIYRDAYEAVTAALHASVEPRLRSEYLRLLAAGGSLKIGSLLLSRDGVSNIDHSTERVVAWEHLPSAMLDGKRVVVAVAADPRRPTKWTVPMMTDNAALLPELLDEAAIAFS